jgi:hypothetical protein
MKWWAYSRSGTFESATSAQLDNKKAIPYKVVREVRPLKLATGIDVKKFADRSLDDYDGKQE